MEHFHGNSQVNAASQKQHIEIIKKQMCRNDRDCEVHWGACLPEEEITDWSVQRWLISQTFQSEHTWLSRWFLRKSKTRGSLIREPDSRKQTMSFGHANYPCRQGAVGGWCRHSQPSSGSIWWCWWTDRWPVRHSAIFLSYFLPQPLIWVRRPGQERSLTEPWHPNQKCSQHERLCKIYFFFYKCFPIILSVSIPSMDSPRNEQTSTLAFFCLFERNVKHILVFWCHKGNSYRTNTSTSRGIRWCLFFFTHQQSTKTIHQF